MIVSIAIAVLPVWRSPMISSRWPRPIGIIASIALMPVCSGSFTGWRWTTPGALNSAGPRLLEVDVALAVERPAERVDDAAEQRVADRDLEQAVRALDRVALLDVAPRAEEHGADVVGLEVEREAGDVVRQLEHLERHAVLEAVDARDAVGDRQDRADLGEVRLAGVEAFDAALEDGRDLVRLDLHGVASLAPCEASRGARPRTTCLRRVVEAVADGGVEHLVADADDDAAEDVGLDGGRQLDLAARSARRSGRRCCAHGLRVELDRGRDLHRQAACCSPPTGASYSRRMRKIAGIRWFSSSSSRKLRKIGSAPETALAQALVLLLRGEVGREEEDLQLAVGVERVGELAELLAHLVELVLRPARPRTASGRRRRRSPPWR